MVRNDSYSNIAPVVLVAGGGGAAILSLLKNTFSYPTCIGGKYKKDVCNEAVYECRAVQGLKWRKGGKECYAETYAKLHEEKYPSQPPVDETKSDTSEKKLSTGAKVGIAVGGLAVFGLVTYLLLRPKK
jgi:hypothetical protein